MQSAWYVPQEDILIHIHYFITRKPGLDEAEFHRYWREVHGPIAARIPQLRRYVQSHRIPAPGSNSPYDGCAEVFLDGFDTLNALREAPEYLQGALADERNFIDLSRVEWMVTHDHIINDVPVAGTVKGLFQLPAKPGLTHLDFRKHWITTHAQAALKMPGIRRYVQSHLVDEAYLYARPRFDGVAHVFFDSAEAMAQSFESPAGKADMADGELFIDVPKMSYFVAREHVVIDSR
jgi:uncharacterized protein (TIGR02118 family)